MKHLTITIATRNRLTKLLRCLASIPDRPDVAVIVCCDNDRETFNLLSPEVARLVLCSGDHIGSPACHNLMAKHANDGLLYLMDDMELYPDTIDKILNEYNQIFPNDDGMMGISQDGTQGSKSGVAVLGKQFLARFPMNQFAYPGYWHFADMETLLLAEKLGKFYLSQTARIKHYHPDDFPAEKDQTHLDARSKKQEDFVLFNSRQEAGVIYGLNDF